MKNGGNPDGIILDGSRKMKPIKYLDDADPEEADRKLVELLVGNITCPQGDRFLILSWLSCFLLLDFTGTRPMTRFEGPAGSQLHRRLAESAHRAGQYRSPPDDRRADDLHVDQSC